MQIFLSVLLHKRLLAISLLRNLTIFFHSSCVWILAENWGKRCCPSLPAWPGSVCPCRLCSYPTPATVPPLNGPSKDFAALQIAEVATSLAKRSLSASALCVWAFPRKSCSAAFLWLRDSCVRNPDRLSSNPDLAALPLTLSHHRGWSWWIQAQTQMASRETTDPEEKHLYFTLVLISQQPS